MLLFTEIVRYALFGVIGFVIYTAINMNSVKRSGGDHADVSYHKNVIGAGIMVILALLALSGVFAYQHANPDYEHIKSQIEENTDTKVAYTKSDRAVVILPKGEAAQDVMYDVYEDNDNWENAVEYIRDKSEQYGSRDIQFSIANPLNITKSLAIAENGKVTYNAGTDDDQ